MDPSPLPSPLALGEGDFLSERQRIEDSCFGDS